MKPILEYLLSKTSTSQISQKTKNEIIKEVFNILTQLYQNLTLIDITKLCDILGVKYNEDEVYMEVDDHSIGDNKDECIDWLGSAFCGSPITYLVDMEEIDSDAIDAFNELTETDEYKKAVEKFKKAKI